MEHLFVKTTQKPSRAEQRTANTSSQYLKDVTMIIHSRLKENRSFSASSQFNRAYVDLENNSHEYRFVKSDVIVNFLLAGIYVMVYNYQRKVEFERHYYGIDKPYWNKVDELISIIRKIDDHSEEKIALALIYSAVRRITMRINSDPVEAVSDDDVAYQVIDFTQNMPNFTENDRGYRFLGLYKISRDRIFPITFDNSRVGNVEVSRDEATDRRYNALTEKQLGITREGDIRSLQYAISEYLDFLDEIGGNKQGWDTIMKSRAKNNKAANDDTPEVIMLISGSLVQVTRLMVSIIAIDPSYELDERENEFINKLSALDHGKIGFTLTLRHKSVLDQVLTADSHKVISHNRRQIMHRIRTDLM